MASYEDLQNALARYADAQEQYWLALEDNAKAIKKGLTEYLGKSGQTVKINGCGEEAPFVSLGSVDSHGFRQEKISQLENDDGALAFTIRIIIELPANTRRNVVQLISIEMSKEDEKLLFTLSEGDERQYLELPAVFNDRHQTQLFDAITAIIIQRLDASQFG